MEEIIKAYMMERALVLVPALWIVGAVVKKTPFVADWLIPYILLALGTAGGLVVVSADISGAIQGILASGLAVLGHQLVKQAGKAATDYTEEGD